MVNYKKIINGPDCFGNFGYQVIIDENIGKNLVDWLEKDPRNYNILYINNPIKNGNNLINNDCVINSLINPGILKGSRDYVVGMIAVLNSSVLITKDKNFFESLNYKKVLINDNTRFNELERALEDLIKSRPCIEGYILLKNDLTRFFDLTKNKFKRKQFRKAIEDYVPNIEWIN